VLRSLRETLATTVIFTVLLGGVAGLLSHVLPGVQERFMRGRFIPPQLMQLRNAILGVDGTTSSVAELSFALVFSHPVLLALLFAHAIILSTRVPAGELERGTLDILLGLPVSRWTLHISETIAWALSAILVLGGIVLGCYIGTQTIRIENRPDWPRLGIVLANLSLVYVVAGCVGMLAASVFDRRGRAVLLTLVFVVSSVLLFLLRLQWEAVERVSVVSFLHYYRPIEALSKGIWPARDLLILGGAIAACWISAGIVLSRRALTTT
jgi:ABC-type transport system involved in multi-copper enzyme maturation permease subunit